MTLESTCAFPASCALLETTVDIQLASVVRFCGPILDTRPCFPLFTAINNKILYVWKEHSRAT